MSRHVTIKDIASRTGVSPGTVDRVIHNRGNVAADVRDKVLAAMRELGYVPNLAARTLANNRTFRIAALLPDYQNDLYWVQPKEGVEKAAAALSHYGVKVDFYFYQNFDAGHYSNMAEKALSGAPDAMIFAPLFQTESEQILEDERWADIPKIMINTQIKSKKALCYIGQDSYESGMLAGRLLDFGLDPGDHAMVLSLDKGVTNARHLLEKERGFKEYFKANRQKDIQIHTQTFEDFDDSAALRALIETEMRQYPRLRGFFVTNSRAFRLVRALEPDLTHSLIIVGFDLIEPNLKLLSEDKISFLINQNARRQGYQAVLVAANALIFKKETPFYQYLPLDIIVKENATYYLDRQLELLPALV